MVKSGYKQTEIGVIPVDWETSKLGTIGQFKNGINKDKDKFGYGVPIIGLMDVFGMNHINSTANSGLVDASLYEQEDYSLQEGDVLFVRSSVKPAGVGLTTVVEQTLQNSVFSGFLLRYRTEKLTTGFKRYAFYASYFRENLIAASTVSANTNINQDSLKQLVLAYPTDEAEQNRIAQTLSNIDALILSLEQQLAKKKTIKQGAMQELLTGKKRLPEFSGGRKSFLFDDLFDFIPNNSFTRAQMADSGRVKNIHYGDILTKYGAYVNAGSKEIPYIAKEVDLNRFAERCYLQSGDVVIADTAEDVTVGKALEVINVDCPVLAGQHTLLCRPKFKFAPKFLGYYLNSECYHAQLLPYVVGTKVSSVSKASVAQTKLVIPEYEEQQAIAEILSNMDAEIEALEQKLVKYRQVKQGMMQQLLTGKIRPKNDIANSVQAEQKASAKTSPARSAHNRQFDDAVAIAAIVDIFYSDKYPLGRVKVQKLLYLLHRHQAVSVSDFKKKAAGPYADTVRYRGGEPIAKKNKYIVSESGKQGTRYSKGKNMAQALDYVEQWGMQADFQWLKENFLHTSRNDLELFATVDMAICDLNEAGVPISVASIKNLIASNKEWKAKLSKTYFSDSDIARAIKRCAELFN